MEAAKSAPLGVGAFTAEQESTMLTARELRIAELAGRGLSNHEIGYRLGLSPRVVAASLYRIFPRMGVTARVQLGDALKEHRARVRDDCRV